MNPEWLGYCQGVSAGLFHLEDHTWTKLNMMTINLPKPQSSQFQKPCNIEQFKIGTKSPNQRHEFDLRNHNGRLELL